MTIRVLNDSTQFVYLTNDTFYIQNRCTGLWPSEAVEIVFYLFFMASSLIGNVLIIAIFFKDKTLRTTVNYFIVNMCVSDLIFPTIILPIWITINLTRNKNLLLVVEIQHVVLCKIMSMSYGVSVLVSLFNMTAIATDRFRAIIFPMKPALFSPKQYCAAIIAMWFSSFAMSSVYHGHATVSSPGNDSCVDTKSTSEGLIFLSAFFALMCLFAVAITVFYLKVAIFLHRQKNSLHLASEVVKKRAKRNRKIITMLIIIVILFYVVYLQYYVMLLFFYIFRVSVPCVYIWFTFVISPIIDRKSTRLNSSHANISYAVFCLKKKNKYPYIALFL